MPLWLGILLVFSPFILFGVIYGLLCLIGWIVYTYTDWKHWKENGPSLPDWVVQMNKIYESPLDWESDNKMTEEYACPHCGAPQQRKVICEYCKSRNEKEVNSK